MPIKYVLLAALLHVTSLALAQVSDHLTPPPDALLQPDALAYRANVGRRLGRALARAPLVQVVVYPSFEPEYLLSVEQTGVNNYTLTYRKAQRSIWDASVLKLPANVSFLNQLGTPIPPPKPRVAPDSIPLTVHQLALQPRLAQALLDLFNVALAQTRYPSNPGLFVDGTRFTFIAHGADDSYRSGDTRSPAAGSHMKQLVTIVAGLQELATNTSDRDFRQGILFNGIQVLLYDLATR